MKPSDEELAAVAATNKDAFAELYRRYVDWIFAFCKQRLATKQAAEDATSLVFSRMLTSIDRFEPRPTFRAWIFTIAQNIVTDSYRRGSRIQFGPLDEQWDGATTDRSPEELAIANDDRDFVHQLMTHLTADQRRVVELRLAELSGPEIQVVLGKSRAWVSTTQHRAIKNMRKAADALRPQDKAIVHE